MKTKERLKHIENTGKMLKNPQFAMSPLYIMVIGVAVFLLYSMSLLAASTTANVNVNANVITNCKFDSAGNNLFFGNYDPQSVTPLDVNGAAQLRCTKGTSVTLSINNGLNASGAQRRMTDGSQFLNYQIYTNATRTTIWNTSNTVSFVSTTSVTTPVTLYGRIPAGQNSGTSGYTDTVTITAAF